MERQEQQFEVRTGQHYRHYKGKEYLVLAVGRHSETLEKFVVYEGQYEDSEFGANPVWIRPYGAFCGEVDTNNARVRRFTLLEAPVAEAGEEL